MRKKTRTTNRLVHVRILLRDIGVSGAQDVRLPADGGALADIA